MTKQFMNDVKEFGEKLMKFYEENENLKSASVSFMAFKEYDVVDINLGFLFNEENFFRLIPSNARVIDAFNKEYILDWKDGKMGYTAYLKKDKFKEWKEYHNVQQEESI